MASYLKQNIVSRINLEEIEYFVKQIKLNNTTKYNGNFSDAYVNESC